MEADSSGDGVCCLVLFHPDDCGRRSTVREEATEGFGFGGKDFSTVQRAQAVHGEDKRRRFIPIIS